MTGTTIQIMQGNRNLEMKYAEDFREFFKRSLHTYMNYLTGFDIVKFDKDIATPDGTPTSMWVQTKYGPEAVNLIRKLI
ncbi:MAG: hypothetical protein WC455_16890 [Dehalococcoidia bacterium]|jgi:hypothetical protein